MCQRTIERRCIYHRASITPIDGIIAVDSYGVWNIGDTDRLRCNCITKTKLLVSFSSGSGDGLTVITFPPLQGIVGLGSKSLLLSASKILYCSTVAEPLKVIFIVLSLDASYGSNTVISRGGSDGLNGKNTLYIL